MSFLNLAVFYKEKNTKIFCVRPSYVMIAPAGNEFNYSFALSPSEKRKSLSLIALSKTPFFLNVSQISQNLQYEHLDHHSASQQIVLMSK